MTIYDYVVNIDNDGIFFCIPQDIACCSLMRLDMNSMDKLWELMVMMFKWQLFVADHPQTLMDITFRHLDGIARLIPEMRKSILVDATKQIIIEYWDQLNDNGKGMIVNNLKQWLKPFNTKISILMRLALQHNDASFVVTPINNEFYDHYSMNLGTNIYAKTAHLQSKDLSKATRPPSSPPSPVTTHEFDMLFDQLGIPSQGAITEASTDQKQVIKEQVPNMLSLSEMLGDVTVRVNNEEREEEQEEDTQGTTLLEMFMKSLNEGQTSSSEFGDLV